MATLSLGSAEVLGWLWGLAELNQRLAMTARPIDMGSMRMRRSGGEGGRAGGAHLLTFNVCGSSPAVESMAAFGCRSELGKVEKSSGK